MAKAVTRENYLLHKLHSLFGIIPIGFYMLQHLALNSFSLMGEDKFNGVINFFDQMPKHVLWTLEIVVIWTPLLFHAILGLVIVNRATPNSSHPKYAWSQNRMFGFQRWTGVFIFIFLCFHVASTTVLAKTQGNTVLLQYTAWHERLTGGPYQVALLVFYMAGILACAYHLAYGVWNFCIRWGITISEAAQLRIQKFAFALFILITILGWSALAGFIRPIG
jgi:succinate dehydrogenase / fumarate reductase cytochrome b subunit